MNPNMGWSKRAQDCQEIDVRWLKLCPGGPKLGLRKPKMCPGHKMGPRAFPSLSCGIYSSHLAPFLIHLGPPLAFLGGGPRGHLEAECGLGSEWLGHDMRQEAKMPQTSRACIKHTVFNKLLEARSRKTTCEIVLWMSFCGSEVLEGLTWTP